jgi:hypothetical protein
MDCGLDNLNCRIIPNVVCDVGWQRNLRQAESTRVHHIAGSGKLENGNHRVRVVGRSGAEPDVDVYECRLMAVEPPRLEGDGAPCYRPFGSILWHW